MRQLYIQLSILVPPRNTTAWLARPPFVLDATLGVVPTDIYFTGENPGVKVVEDPGQVAEAFASADGFPFRLTDLHRGGDVYVNPASVAFWSASESGPEPGPPPEESEPATGRGAVTDIWGQPLRRKPRR